MKRFHKRKIWISSLLALSLLINVLSASAESVPVIESQEKSTVYSLNSVPDNIKSLLKEQTDVISIQKDDDIYSLTTNKNDGSHNTTVYSVPIKFENKNGEKEFIDTSIVSNGLIEKIFQDYQYKNKANNLTTEFSTNINKGVRFTTDGSILEMKPKGSVSSQSNKTNVQVSTDIKTGSINSDINDAFIYHNAFGADTEVKYYNTNTGVKEDIILNRNIGKNRFEFEINTNGDIPKLTQGSEQIEIYDKNDLSKLKYRFGSLYAYDSYTPEPDLNSPETIEMDLSVQEGNLDDIVYTDGEQPFHHFTLDCHYELTDLGDSKYKVTIVVSEEWLNHPYVVYPVTIDPPISATSSQSNIDDTYAPESRPNANYVNSDRIRFGLYEGKRCYSYLRFITMPSLSNVAITNATLKLKLLNGTSSASSATAWRINQAWNGYTLTWNANRPTNAEGIQYRYGHNNFTGYNINIDCIVGKWYSGYANYGVLIDYGASVNDYNAVYSSDCGVAERLPKLDITYESLQAIENGTYFIRNNRSGKYIDVNGQYTTSGANIHQWDFHGGTSQQWQITNTSGKWYTIRPKHASSMAMDVNGGSANNEVNIQQYTYSGSDAQKFGFVRNTNGSYRIVTKITGGAKCLAVKDAVTTNGGNILQYTYGSMSNDEWYLTPADNRIIGEFRLFVSDHSSTSSSSLVTGHAFISVKNTSDLTIPMGALNIPSNTEMSFGTWDLPNHSGIIYNLETCKNHEEEQSHYINVKTILRGSDLADLNNHMATHDFWEWNNNCSYFAISMWGLVSSAPVKFNYWLEDIAIETPYMLKRAVLVCGQPIEYGRILTRVTPIGFVENGAFVDRSANNPQD